MQSSQNKISPPTIRYLRPSVKADSPVDVQDKVESETRLLEKVRSPSSGKFVTPSTHPSADNKNMSDDGTDKTSHAEGWVSVRALFDMRVKLGLISGGRMRSTDGNDIDEGEFEKTLPIKRPFWEHVKHYCPREMTAVLEDLPHNEEVVELRSSAVATTHVYLP